MLIRNSVRFCHIFWVNLFWWLQSNFLKSIDMMQCVTDFYMTKLTLYFKGKSFFYVKLFLFVMLLNLPILYWHLLIYFWYCFVNIFRYFLKASLTGMLHKLFYLLFTLAAFFNFLCHQLACSKFFRLRK